jgi:putative DNA primase/helicase
MAVNTEVWAEYCVARFSFKLVPLKEQGKCPIRKDWNADEQLIGTIEGARSYWSRHPHANVGVCLEPSGLTSVDVDDLEGARRVLRAEGIDLDALIARTPTIVGRTPRLEFKAPGVPLTRKSLVWPARWPGAKPVTVLELRAGRCQDVLPPSIHPNGQRYRWLTPPRHGFPPLPQSLLALWTDFDAFKHRARNLCPWADPEPEPAAPQPRRIGVRTGPSVIAAFNEAHDPAALLEAHGYIRAGTSRFKSPNGHGVAGVVVLPSGRVYCHHASDEQLGGEHAHDAFDLYRIFEHGGDFRAAVREAAQALGMKPKESYERRQHP